MRNETLTESRPAVLALEAAEADALRALGQQLASKATWWGADEDSIPADDTTERTVVRCVEVSAGMFEVTVANAVGLIAVGSALQIYVRPKIPETHFLYLLEVSGFFPRRGTDQGFGERGQHLWSLLAAWYVDAVEHVMRRGIVFDYVDRIDEIEFVRGRINVQRTALSYYQGRLDLECEYEDFGQDTPLNRTLRAAGERIVSSPSLPTRIRRRMRAILTRFDEVGPLRHGDRRSRLDLRTRHYGDAISLAGHIIDGVHRVLGHGDELAWTFLIPTPLLVEAGVRRELTRHLAPHIKVDKRSLPLTGTTMRMNPDLVFGDIAAVGDVKYKLMSTDWSRSDLNQIVAFAAAARTNTGIVIGFHPSETATLPAVGVGEFDIIGVSWRADEDVDPRTASEELARHVQSLLQIEESAVAA
jgi:hypothetical protein